MDSGPAPRGASRNDERRERMGTTPSAIMATTYALADQSGTTIPLFEIQMTVQNRNFSFARRDRTWADLFSTHEAPTKEG